MFSTILTMPKIFDFQWQLIAALFCILIWLLPLAFYELTLAEKKELAILQHIAHNIFKDI